MRRPVVISPGIVGDKNLHTTNFSSLRGMIRSLQADMRNQKVSAARFVSVHLLSVIHATKQPLLKNQPHLLAISTKYYGVQSRLSIGCLVELGNG